MRAGCVDYCAVMGYEQASASSRRLLAVRSKARGHTRKGVAAKHRSGESTSSTEIRCAAMTYAISISLTRVCRLDKLMECWQPCYRSRLIDSHDRTAFPPQCFAHSVQTTKPGRSQKTCRPLRTAGLAFAFALTNLGKLGRPPAHAGALNLVIVARRRNRPWRLAKIKVFKSR